MQHLLYRIHIMRVMYLRQETMSVVWRDAQHRYQDRMQKEMSTAILVMLAVWPDMQAAYRSRMLMALLRES